jgi:hypothetical protein
VIWRIFKKDWSLLWPLVLIVGVAHAINALIALMQGNFRGAPGLVRISNLFPAAVLLGVGALIVAAVHQDALPGDRQDWLVRPIRRRDLVLEKLLFVLIAVNGPMLVIDMAHCLAAGFGFGEALSAAVSRGTYMLLTFNLPVLGLAALTSTLVEVIGSFLAICVLVVVIHMGVISMAPPNVPTFGTMSNSWVMLQLWSVVALATALIVIPLQYFRRVTTSSRALALGVALFLPITAFIPWSTAFGFQQWLSVDPRAAKAVAIAFDPNVGKMILRRGTPSRPDSLWLPLQVSGLPPEAVVLNDRADIRIIGHDGTVLYRGTTIGTAPAALIGGVAAPVAVDDFPVRSSTGGQVATHQLISLPHKIYEEVRSQRVRVELEYSLSLFGADASDTIPALNGDKRIANLGLCRTQIDDDGDEIEIGCLKTGPEITCGTFMLENAVTGKHNPAASFCNKYYPPITAHFLPNALMKFGGELAFRDPRGLATYPVDNSQLASARVSVKTYKPIAHFTRHLIIPDIHLGDWETATRVAAGESQ